MLSMHVLFTLSGTTPHRFEKFSAQHPVFCYECENVLWGLARQGLKCTGKRALIYLQINVEVVF